MKSSGRTGAVRKPSDIRRVHLDRCCIIRRRGKTFPAFIVEQRADLFVRCNIENIIFENSFDLKETQTLISVGGSISNTVTGSRSDTITARVILEVSDIFLCHPNPGFVTVKHK